MLRNLRTEGFMKGIRVINSCISEEHFISANRYISNYAKLFGKETFGGEYVLMLSSHLRERKKLYKNG